MTKSPLGTIQLSLRILRDARAFRSKLLLLFIFSLTTIPFAVLVPLPLKIIVDYALTGRPFSFGWGPEQVWAPLSLIALAAGLEFAILLGKGALDFGIWLYQIYLEEAIVADGRARLFRHVLQLSLQTHDRKGIADLFYRLQNDIGSMHTIAANGLIPLASTALTFLIMFTIAFRMDPALALLALGVLPFTWGIGRYYLPRIRVSWTDVKRADQSALGVIQEVLGAMRVVKAFSQEEREVRRFQGQARQKLNRVVHASVREAGFRILITAVVAAGSAGAIYIGARNVHEGTLTLGNFLIISAYLLQLFRPLDFIGKQTSTMQAALVSGERYFRLLNEDPELQTRANARPMRRARGRVEFRNVSFAYPKGPEVLREVSLSIAPGQRVGLIGETGAGKTTLLSLLLRFMDPTSGLILLDGVDLRDLRLADLRRQFAVVLQEPVLFGGTIAENISYGRPNASHDDIVAAAKVSQAHDFIMELPEGYETQVGERGMSLSGGERQRVSIARACLMDAPVLILDEPTSQLDQRHEASIREGLAQLKEGRTTFTVTHRLALLDDYDLILRVGEAGISVVERPRPLAFVPPLRG